MGGLGNQLQQYALYRKFISLGAAASIDDSTWFDAVPDSATKRDNMLPAVLKHMYVRAEKADIALRSGKIPRHLPFLRDRYYLENTDDKAGGRQYDPTVLSLRDSYLEGFWACEAYYSDIMDIIRQEVILPDVEPLPGMTDGNSVSVHIRRRDYLDPENAKLFGGIATDAYYRGALSLIGKTCGEVRVFIFTDDPEYFKERPGSFTDADREVVVSGEGGMLEDLALMRMCRHHICSNSTYAFWGARLDGGDGIRVRPSIHKNTQLCNSEDMHKWWVGWTITDPSGNPV